MGTKTIVTAVHTLLLPRALQNMADTPDEAPPPEPVIDKDQMIADLQQELADSEALIANLEADDDHLTKIMSMINDLDDDFSVNGVDDIYETIKMLKTPKKVKDGLKKDGSPDMRQTKGKALAAAAAADTDPPASIKYRISIYVEETSRWLQKRLAVG